MKQKELYERFCTYGAGSLSNRELVAIITGDEKSAGSLMDKTVGRLNPIGSMLFPELRKAADTTDLKAFRLVAALEMGRRKQIESCTERTLIKSSQDIAGVLQAYLSDSIVEKFVVIFLNRANYIKKIMTVSEGGLTGTVADPRVILRHAVLEGAVSIVLSHNHPSGSLRPSRADEQLTAKIKSAAGFLDITVLDHIIVSEQGYFSFADEGLI